MKKYDDSPFSHLILIKQKNLFGKPTTQPNSIRKLMDLSKPAHCVADGYFIPHTAECPIWIAYWVWSNLAQIGSCTSLRESIMSMIVNRMWMSKRRRLCLFTILMPSPYLFKEWPTILMSSIKHDGFDGVLSIARAWLRIYNDPYLPKHKVQKVEVFEWSWSIIV